MRLMDAIDWQPLDGPADELGESPFWHPGEQRLYWVDIPGRQLHRCAGPGTPVESRALPQEPGCIAPARSGGLVVALRDGIYRLRSWEAALEQLAAAQHDTAKARFNDGKADPAGRLWAGTLHEPRDAPLAGLYCLDRSSPSGPVQRLEKRLGGVTTANGLAFSPDGRTLYWADTPSHLIRRWDLDLADASLANEREFHRFAAKPAGWQPGQPGYGGRPDGAAIDGQGHYWSALYEGARLVRLSPEGRVVGELPLPVQCPTMPCFGGPDLRTLFVTTARSGRPPDELKTQPLAGRVLWARAPVAGRPVDFFAD
jgi:sugar lactone lactonase YvrE